MTTVYRGTNGTLTGWPVYHSISKILITLKNIYIYFMYYSRWSDKTPSTHTFHSCLAGTVCYSKNASPLVSYQIINTNRYYKEAFFVMEGLLTGQSTNRIERGASSTTSLLQKELSHHHTAVNLTRLQKVGLVIYSIYSSNLPLQTELERASLVTERQSRKELIGKTFYSNLS